MSDIETLKNEVKDLLSGKKSELSEIKKVVYDGKVNQYSIKIPKKIADGAKLNNKTELKLIVNPSELDFDEAFGSHFIIYAKEKKST